MKTIVVTPEERNKIMETTRGHNRIVLYGLCVKKWGSRAQLIAALEELGELSSAIAKELNGKLTDLYPIVTELADVKIMIEQVEMILGLESKVRDEVQFKLDRLAARVTLDRKVQVKEEEDGN